MTFVLVDATRLWGGLLFFFFQAEDGIRDYKVTGVQTCALPIWQRAVPWLPSKGERGWHRPGRGYPRRASGSRAVAPRDRWSARRGTAIPSGRGQIGRASCRERV